MPDDSIFAYVFIAEPADPRKSVKDFVDKLTQERAPNVLFAVDVAGAYEGFAVIEAQTLDGLQDVLADAELWADQKNVLIEAKPGAHPAKRETCDKLAIVRIRTRRGSAEDVFNRLNEFVEADLAEFGRQSDDRRYYGVSMVFGSFDILLTLNAHDFETLKELALGLQSIDGLDGIVRTETSFADCTRAYKRLHDA
jgi:hypothetical protein